MSSDKSKSEFIVEFQQHGSSVKVTVFDPVTMTEVSIVGPSSAGQAELQRTALQKLHYVMNKKDGIPSEEPTASPQPQKKPGIIV